MCRNEAEFEAARASPCKVKNGYGAYFFIDSETELCLRDGLEERPTGLLYDAGE